MPLVIAAKHPRWGAKPCRGDGSASVVSVRPFAPLGPAAVVRQRLSNSARQRFETALHARAGWYGRRIAGIFDAGDNPATVRGALEEAAPRADVVIAAVVASVDPLDVTWQSLLAAGAVPVRRGLPVQGSNWLADLHQTLVIGVASCGMILAAQRARPSADAAFARQSAAMRGVTNLPRPCTSTSPRSPGFIHALGSRPRMTPCGVPVAIAEALKEAP